MRLDPELEGSQPPPYTLSVEPCKGETYIHGFHLGTDLNIARAFAQEIFNRVNLRTGCYTVQIRRGNTTIDVFDGRDWWAQTAIKSLK